MDTGASTMQAFAQPGRVSGRRPLEICAFVILLVVNWIFAEQAPSPVFSYTSLLLFIWMTLLLIRLHPRAAILALPLLITRGATLISLVFIEGGAAMPEVGRSGVAGDASASFTAFSTLLFLVFALVFAAGERAVLTSARSPLLDRIVSMLRWPIVGLCAALGLLAVVQGLHTGFPVFEHVDRFYYRRFYGQGIVLILLDNKFLLGAALGSVAFGRNSLKLTRLAASGALVGLLGTFFLFGDKFFTLLTMVTYFMMPYLLNNERVLLKTLAKSWLVATLALGGVFAATLYIYSDYGDAPLSVRHGEARRPDSGSGRTVVRGHPGRPPPVRLRQRHGAQLRGLAERGRSGRVRLRDGGGDLLLHQSLHAAAAAAVLLQEPGLGAADHGVRSPGAGRLRLCRRCASDGRRGAWWPRYPPCICGARSPRSSR